MPEFKIAEGYIEVEARVDRDQLRRAAMQAGSDSGDTFSQAMGRRVQRDRTLGAAAAGSFLGNFAAEFFKPNAALLRAMRTGIPAVMASPAGVAGSAVGAIFIYALASAVISSAALGLVGTALVGLGAFGVSASQTVQKSFTNTARRVKNAFHDSAVGLVEPFKNAIDQVGTFFTARIAPKLRSIFDQIAPAIEPLFASALKAVDRFLGAIEPNIHKLTPVLVSMGQQLPRLADAAAQFINTMLDHGPDVARAFEGLVTVVVQLLDALEDIVIVGVNIWNFFFTFENFIKNSFLSNFVRPGGIFATGIEKLIGLLPGVKGASVKSFGATGDAAKALGGQIDRYTTIQMASNETMREAIENAGGLKNALDELAGGALATRAAERKFQAAIDDVTQSVRDNGQTLDTSTAAGRSNQAALDNIAESAKDLADATYKETKATKGHKNAQIAAVEVLNNGRQQLIKSAEQMGLNKKQAEALADEILDIPKNWKTNFGSNANSAKGAVNSYKDAILSVPLFRRTTLLNEIITKRYGVNAPQVNRFGNLYMAQQGLVNLDRSRMFGPGGRTLFGFREPATGGEAFIARNAPRDRSLAILQAAAQWHDAMVVPAQDMASSAQTIAQGVTRGGDGAGVTYNFAPGSVVLDASKMRSVEDLIRMIGELRSTARQFGARVVMP